MFCVSCPGSENFHFQVVIEVKAGIQFGRNAADGHAVQPPFDQDGDGDEYKRAYAMSNGIGVFEHIYDVSYQ